MEEEEPLPLVEDKDEFFYLLESNINPFRIFKTLRQYLGTEYQMDSSILLALIKDSELQMTKTLEQIPYIYSGYINIVSPKGKSSGE